MKMKKEYKIRISYRTGNSFGSSDEEDVLEVSWYDLDVAKENLKRIKAHYDYYDYMEHKRWNRKEVEKPECWEGDYNKCEWGLKLLTDDGNIWQIRPYWCGYFEQLHGAEIIVEKDEEMRFEYF